MTTDKTGLCRWKKLALLTSIVLTGLAVIKLQAPPTTAADSEQWLSVNSAPLVHSIALAGKIEPHKTVFLSAPFEGNIQALPVEQGQRVDQGQLLLTLDPTLIETQLRDALAAQLKARRVEQEMKDWDNSAQVVRARRTVRTAEMTLSNLQRRLDDTQQLLERGIIPRNELDDLNQQLQMQRLELNAAQNELQQTLAQGTGEQRRIAEMELTNATVKYEGLRALLDGQNIVAPFTGVIVPANTSSRPDAGTAPLQAGSRLSQGQVVFGLADIERLKIVALASELDVNQLHAGQSVEIEGDGFEGERLSGTVQNVSSLAEAGDEANGSAKFSVTLSLPPLTPEQLRRVRLGMSARLSITTYRNEQAIVVPPQAIRQEGSGWVVDYREAMDRPVQPMTVTTGRSSVGGVEVFGLLPGLVRVVDQGNL